MCGCEHHWNESAPCTCSCPEHEAKVYDWKTDEQFDAIVGKGDTAQPYSPLNVLIATLAAILLCSSPAVVIWIWRVLL